MRAHDPMLLAETAAAIDDATRMLLQAQDPDGAWRDYALPPGASEAWTTSVVGWALSLAADAPGVRDALTAAADALHRLRRPSGWSYNRHTASDADSTAWAVRFLLRCRQLRGLEAIALLRPYLDAAGAAHTFIDVSRFGRWADAHADVTPVVGLALAEAGAPAAWGQAIRGACHAARDGPGVWCSFWWQVQSYAVARNLEFLDASGGIGQEVGRAALAWLEAAPPAHSAFDAAQRLTITRLLRRNPGSALQALLAWREPHAGWPPSAVLLVPAQHGVPDRPPAPHADQGGLMSTAMALGALRGVCTDGGDVD